MVLVVCEAVPDSFCYNYGETWAKPIVIVMVKHLRSPIALNYFLLVLTKPLA